MDRRTSETEELLRANREFYRAFASADFVAMDRVWSDHQEALCVHPGWALLRGRDQVMASWRGILRRPMPVQVREQRAQLLGELAVVVCVELLAETELAATNLFVREQGRWRMFHHHAGFIAERLGDDDEEGDEGAGDEEEPGERLLN